jgi:hypothetical protein
MQNETFSNMEMPLGEVLERIYKFPAWAAVYLPRPGNFDPLTSCVVSLAQGDAEESMHKQCIEKGFGYWLNVAVITDIYDNLDDKADTDELLAVFNAECQEGGWLKRHLKWRR